MFKLLQTSGNTNIVEGKCQKCLPTRKKSKEYGQVDLDHYRHVEDDLFSYIVTVTYINPEIKQQSKLGRRLTSAKSQKMYAISVYKSKNYSYCLLNDKKRTCGCFPDSWDNSYISHEIVARWKRRFVDK